MARVLMLGRERRPVHLGNAGLIRMGRIILVLIAAMVGLGSASPAWAVTVDSVQGVQGTTELRGVACPDSNTCYGVGDNSAIGAVVSVPLPNPSSLTATSVPTAPGSASPL